MTNPLNEKAPLHEADNLNRTEAPPASEEQVMEAPHPVDTPETEDEEDDSPS